MTTKKETRRILVIGAVGYPTYHVLIQVKKNGAWVNPEK